MDDEDEDVDYVPGAKFDPGDDDVDMDDFEADNGNDDYDEDDQVGSRYCSISSV